MPGPETGLGIRTEAEYTKKQNHFGRNTQKVPKLQTDTTHLIDIALSLACLGILAKVIAGLFLYSASVPIAGPVWGLSLIHI